MIHRKRHLGIPCSTGPLVVVAARAAEVALAGLLMMTPAWPQAAPATQSSAVAAPSQAAKPSTPPPPRDKARARNAFQAGRRAEQAGDWKTEFALYSEAAEYDSSNREYGILKEHARFQVVQSLTENAERQVIAGNTPGARQLLTEALAIDPSFLVARERLQELTPSMEEIEAAKGPQLGGLQHVDPIPGSRSFDFRGTTRGAYEEIGKQFGVKMVFDGDLTDRAVLFRVPELDFDTAVKVLARQTRTFTRVVDTHTLFVTADTPQKEKDYTIEVEKELLLPASVSPDEMNEVVRMIREMTGISRTQLNTATRTLTVRSSEQNVALAQTLLEQVEQPHGELMLEIEILQVDRNTANQLGITPPTSASLFMLSLPEIQQLQAAQNSGSLIQALGSIFGSSAVSSATGAALPALIAFGGGKTIFLATMPSATANFGSALSTVHGAQRVLIRAQDGKPATFFVGDRYPIDLGLLSSGINSATASLSQSLLSGLSLPRTDYSTGRGPISVAIATFNTTNGGHPDLAVANQTDGNISILAGNGDGTFANQTTIDLPGVTTGTTTVAASPSAIVTGDFNDDGFPDIAVTDKANSRVLILLGNGDGSFKIPAVAYPTGSNPVALLAQDLDGDGQVDLAVVNQGDGTTAGSVSILLGNRVNGVRDGTFLPKTDFPVGVSPSAITAAVFNTGGFTDLAVTNKADNTVSILIALGTNGVQNGTFDPQKTFDTGKGPAGVATADFNADSKPDLAVTNQTDNSVSILIGNGDGTFQTQTTATVGSAPTGIVAASFAGAGTDLAIADESSNNVDVLVGNGDGTFTGPISLPTGNSPVSLAGQDLNGDGTIDLVTANNASDSVTVTLNTLQTSISSSAQTGYPSAEYEDLGLKIKATPRLHPNNEVTLQLQFDIKSLTGSSINGIPILNSRQIEQTIRLRENETSILSGLIQTNKMDSTSGWPWTSTEPGIGLLTGEDTGNVQQSEMLILVTPRALRMPPQEVPAIYAGRGEPATPPAPPPPPQAPALGNLPPGQAGAANPNQPAQPGRAPFTVPGVQPGQAQPGQVPGGAVPPPQQQQVPPPQQQ